MSKSIPQTEEKMPVRGTNFAHRRPSNMSHIYCQQIRKSGRGRRLSFVAVAAIAVILPVALCQKDVTPTGATPPAAITAVKPMEFDVVSVKPNKSGSGMIRVMNKPDGYSGTNVSLSMVLEMAYGIKQDLISGIPSWADSANFDIEAKLADSDVAELKKLDKDQRELARKQLLQGFLADRFQLKVHIEIKQLPVYELLVAKSGSTMKEAKPGDTYDNGVKGLDGVAHAGMMMVGNEGSSMQLTGQGIPVASLVAMLSQQLHRTVIDKTGLTGNYDIKLKWTPEDTSAAASSDAGSDTGPSLLSALQEQLGLKIQSAKGPVDTLVVDHVEKPTEN
jgi:uncharacterized protein (TIGR03435 family)